MDYHVFIPDKISKTSIKMFSDAGICAEQKPGIEIAECSRLSNESDVLVVRSYDLHKLEVSQKLKAIGRAGAGVNNIPIDMCSKNGVVVFNTPGANANAVKELVLCGLLLSSRKIVDGINWTALQKEQGAEIPKIVEKGKGQFKGNEIMGKTLGVMGLGAIGMLIANDCVGLGMHVIGHDPYITVENAWRLSSNVGRAKDIDHLLKSSDYLTIHVPLTAETKASINKSTFSKMKKGVRIMNFSRDEIVNTDELVDALKQGIVGAYVTDFPNHKLLEAPNVICIPHLGASTDEAEENCAVMVTNQLVNYLKEGTISNAVNFPNCSLDRHGKQRITIISKNVPGLLEKITSVLADAGCNIEEMINKSRGNFAYTILDINAEVSKDAMQKLKEIEGMIKVRWL